MAAVLRPRKMLTWAESGHRLVLQEPPGLEGRQTGAGSTEEAAAVTPSAGGAGGGHLACSDPLSWESLSQRMPGVLISGGLLGDTSGIKATCDVVFSPSLHQPLIHVFAKNLVTFVSQEAGNRAVLLAMAMKDRSMEGLRALKEVIQTCQVW